MNLLIILICEVAHNGDGIGGCGCGCGGAMMSNIDWDGGWMDGFLLDLFFFFFKVCSYLINNFIILNNVHVMYYL